MRGWFGLVWGIVCVCAAGYGLLLIVDGTAYLAGAGPQTTIYIQGAHQDVETDTDSNGVPTEHITHYGDGYYLDDAGRRQAISVPGDDLKPGMVLHTRRPWLFEQAVFVLHAWWQAAAEVFLGLLSLAGGVWTGFLFAARA